MKTIVIATSKFGRPVSDYFKELGKAFIKDGFRIIYIFDGALKVLPEDKNNIHYYTWSNKRPTKLKDFIFLYKIIKRYKPILCISNFGSTNVVSIVSYFSHVKNRVNFIHTTTKAILNDSTNRQSTKLQMLRKKYIYKLNTHLFTNSSGTKIDTVKFYGIDKNKIYVFPILIKSSDIKYRTEKQRKKQLLIVGGLSPTKGHKYLIYQFSNCLINFPELKLKIIGSGYLENELKELVFKLKIDNNVIFTGGISNNKVKEEFSESLISISSSVDEAYGLVNIEALREGTPLVCTKTAGSMDILEEGFNGEFFNHKDENSLCQAVSEIFDNWDKYSKNCLIAFENKYSIEKKIQEHKGKIIDIL